MRRWLLPLVLACGLVCAAQPSSTQNQTGAPARRSPLADYAGVWIASFQEKPWMTIRLTLQGNQLSGSIQRAQDLQFNDQGEIKGVSEERLNEAVQDATVNPDGLLLTVKNPDTQETDRFTLKLTGETTAEVKMSAMKMPPGMPKIKPWKLMKSGASPAQPRSGKATEN